LVIVWIDVVVSGDAVFGAVLRRVGLTQQFAAQQVLGVVG
jgi:hypothetical protein